MRQFNFVRYFVRYFMRDSGWQIAAKEGVKMPVWRVPATDGRTHRPRGHRLRSRLQWPLEMATRPPPPKTTDD